MRNIYHVKTPENVSIEYELAGIGSRGAAIIIDTFIQNFVLLLFAVLLYASVGELSFDLTHLRKNTKYIVIAILLIFIVRFGYFLLFEYFMKGSTPGKKIVGLRVIMANGEPVTFAAALVRNLLRTGDMLPGVYGVGILSIILNERYMRVGDLAANTIVIKEKNRKPDFFSIRKNSTEQPAIFISSKEEALLIEYAERLKDRETPLYSAVLESQLYHHFYGKLGVLPNLPKVYDEKIYLKCLLDLIGIDRA